MEKLNDLSWAAHENLHPALNKVNDGSKYEGLHRMSMLFLYIADDCRYYGT